MKELLIIIVVALACFLFGWNSHRTFTKEQHTPTTQQKKGLLTNEK